MRLIVDVDTHQLVVGRISPVRGETLPDTLSFISKGVPQRLPVGTGILIGVKQYKDPTDTLLASAVPVRPDADGSPYTYTLSLNTAELLAKFTAGVTYFDCSIEVKWEVSPGSATYKKTNRKKLQVSADTIRDMDSAPLPMSSYNDFIASSGTGLLIDVAAGKLNGSIISAQPSVAIVNGTNYVELNGSGVAVANAVGWTAGYYPLAVVVASGGAITSNIDIRGWLNGGVGSGSITIDTTPVSGGTVGNALIHGTGDVVKEVTLGSAAFAETTDFAPAGAGVGTYIYNKLVAAATWVITHGLSSYPSVTVVDSSGSRVEGDVHYDSNTQVTITFSAAFAGKAYLN